MNRYKSVLLIVTISILALIFFGLSKLIFANNVFNNENSDTHELYVPTKASYNDVLNTLEKDKIVKNIKTFDWVAQQMKYNSHIKPGRYIFPDNIGNKALVTLLRSGAQTPVKLTISNINTTNDLIMRISQNLEASPIELDSLLCSPSYLDNFDLDSTSILSKILPDTYEFYWNTSADGFLKKMLKESDKFWTASNKKAAKALNLSEHDVIVLASIVQKESNQLDEYSRIAGVYINRIQKGWALQADPTVKFAMNRPDLRRVLRKHTEFDSPYNTYKYTGLPPGPICLPEKTAIRAVLNAENHDYMYFCAKEDFSGYHVFARNLRDHNRNAKKYQKALDKRGIL